MDIFTDVETIPCQNLPKDSMPVFDETKIKMANLKDPVKIKAKIEEERVKFQNGLDKKMSLDPGLCQIISIGITIPALKKEHIYFSQSGDAGILDDFNNYLSIHSCPIRFIGWKIKTFDMAVIWKRMILNGIRPAFDLEKVIHPYDHRYCLDLMSIWNFGGRGSLANCAKRLGIECKTGMDGSMVYDAFKDGKFEEIKEYNLEDCRVTKAIYDRMYP